MSKFKKRIAKSMTKPLNDCLVMGSAFGFLEDVVESFNTIFLFGEENENLRGKNLIYRPTIEVAYNMPHITAIFIDYKYIDCFDKLVPILTSAAPDLFIEGNDVVPKTETTELYRHGYRAIKQLGWCHQWSRIA